MINVYYNVELMIILCFFCFVLAAYAILYVSKG